MPHSKQATAIARLEKRLQTYDTLKSEHADLTKDLTEAKKAVDEAARLVVGITNDPQMDLPLEESEADQD